MRISYGIQESSVCAAGTGEAKTENKPRSTQHSSKRRGMLGWEDLSALAARGGRKFQHRATYELRHI